MDWSETQEKALRADYMLPQEGLMKLFPGKSWDSIRGKIYRMGLSRRGAAIAHDAELQGKFCDGCPSTYDEDCPVTKSGHTWRVCNWKATYQETGVWGNKN